MNRYFKLIISRRQRILITFGVVILGTSFGGRLLASSKSTQGGSQAASKPDQKPEASAQLLPDGEGDAAKGKEAFQTSCALCHEVSNKAKLGPGLQGISQKGPHKLSDGTDVADESTATLRKQIVKGAGVMPPAGATLSDKQVDDLIAYLRTL
jgi:mono/diheme cytochrome c family protein